MRSVGARRAPGLHQAFLRRSDVAPERTHPSICHIRTNVIDSEGPKTADGSRSTATLTWVDGWGAAAGEERNAVRVGGSWQDVTARGHPPWRPTVTQVPGVTPRRPNRNVSRPELRHAESHRPEPIQGRPTPARRVVPMSTGIGRTKEVMQPAAPNPRAGSGLGQMGVTAVACGPLAPCVTV